MSTLYHRSRSCAPRSGRSRPPPWCKRPSQQLSGLRLTIQAGCCSRLVSTGEASPCSDGIHAYLSVSVTLLLSCFLPMPKPWDSWLVFRWRVGFHPIPTKVQSLLECSTGEVQTARMQLSKGVEQNQALEAQVVQQQEQTRGLQRELIRSV